MFDKPTIKIIEKCGNILKNILKNSIIDMYTSKYRIYIGGSINGNKSKRWNNCVQ